MNRRTFLTNASLAVAGGAISIQHALAMYLPAASLDHIIFGISDLDEGIRIIEQKTGVRAVRGGVHPHLGTRNALLSLGKDKYLEIIAPNPGNKVVAQFKVIESLPEGKIIGWAAQTDNINGQLQAAEDKKYDHNGISPGQRKTDDNKVLNWKALSMSTKIQEVMPFFIEWGKGTPHPASTSPEGCKLESFIVYHPNPAIVSATFKNFGLRTKVEKGEMRMVLKMNTPKGLITL